MISINRPFRYPFVRGSAMLLSLMFLVALGLISAAIGSRYLLETKKYRGFLLGNEMVTTLDFVQTFVNRYELQIRQAWKPSSPKALIVGGVAIPVTMPHLALHLDAEAIAKAADVLKLPLIAERIRTQRFTVVLSLFDLQKQGYITSRPSQDKLINLANPQLKISSLLLRHPSDSIAWETDPIALRAALKTMGLGAGLSVILPSTFIAESKIRFTSSTHVPNALDFEIDVPIGVVDRPGILAMRGRPSDPLENDLPLSIPPSKFVSRYGDALEGHLDLNKHGITSLREIDISGNPKGFNVANAVTITGTAIHSANDFFIRAPEVNIVKPRPPGHGRDRSPAPKTILKNGKLETTTLTLDSPFTVNRPMGFTGSDNCTRDDEGAFRLNPASGEPAVCNGMHWESLRGNDAADNNKEAIDGAIGDKGPIGPKGEPIYYDPKHQVAVSKRQFVIPYDQLDSPFDWISNHTARLISHEDWLSCRIVKPKNLQAGQPQVLYLPKPHTSSGWYLARQRPYQTLDVTVNCFRLDITASTFRRDPITRSAVMSHPIPSWLQD